MDNNHTETQETFTREEQIHFAGWENREEEPLEIEQQYQIKEDSPNETSVEEKPFVRTLFIYGLTGIGLLFLVLIWQLMSPEKAPVTIVESPTDETTEVIVPEIDYRGKLALRDQKHQLEEKEQKPQELPEITSIEEPITPPPITQPPKPQPTTQPRVVRTAPPPTPRPRQTVQTQPKVNPEQQWAKLANFGQGTHLASSQITKNQTPTTTFVNTVVTNPISTNTSNSSSLGAQGIMNRRTIEPKIEHQIAYGTKVTASVSIPLLWDESLSSSQQPNKRFALTLNEDLLTSDGQVALAKGMVVVAETSSVNPDNRLVNANAVAVIDTNQQGTIQQRSIPPQKLTILGKRQQPLIAKGYLDRGGDYARTDLLVSSLSGLGKIGEVFTEPNTSSSVVSGSFGSSVSTVVENSNREVWSAALDGFFNPLAERISDRSLRQEKELEKLPNIAVLEVGTEVTIIANDTFVIK